MPTPSAVTTPVALTLATEVLFEPHVALTFDVVPLLYAAVAVTVIVPPTFNVTADTLTERLVTVCVDEVGAVGDELEPDPPPQEVPSRKITASTRCRSRPAITLEHD